MSQLFEALQISVSEKSGTSFAGNVQGAAELLQSSEEDSRPVVQAASLQITATPESRLVSLTAEHSLGAEKFRFLAVKLRQMKQARSLKRVLVTSSIAEEGKSFVSANLAIALAKKRNQRVLLIEGDLRRPGIAHEFGLGALPGLSETLAGHGEPLNHVYNLLKDRLWFLPAGHPPGNPLELMQSGHLPELMGQISESYDWVIIDSPPVLPLGDTTVWSRNADGILLVVREGKTEKSALRRGIEALGKSNLIGVVVNSCSNVDHSNYYQRYGTLPNRTVSDAAPAINE